jgi:hypothetical protein
MYFAIYALTRNSFHEEEIGRRIGVLDVLCAWPISILNELLLHVPVLTKSATLRIEPFYIILIWKGA